MPRISTGDRKLGLVLLSLSRQYGNEAVLRAAKRLPKTPTSAGKPGRREYDDELCLLGMARLIAKNNMTDWAAACAVAAGCPGHSLEATQRRLYRKFRPHRRKLIAAAEHERQQIAPNLSWLAEIVDGMQKLTRNLDPIVRKLQQLGQIPGPPGLVEWVRRYQTLEQNRAKQVH